MAGLDRSFESEDIHWKQCSQIGDYIIPFKISKNSFLNVLKKELRRFSDCLFYQV